MQVIDFLRTLFTVTGVAVGAGAGVAAAVTTGVGAGVGVTAKPIFIVGVENVNPEILKVNRLSLTE